jgi:hypothetical protein
MNAQLKKAREALRLKEWAKALSIANSVVDQIHSDPEQVNVYYMALVFRGLSLLHLNQIEESENAYRTASQLPVDDQQQPLAYQVYNHEVEL